MNSTIRFALLSLVMVGIGLAAGFYAARQTHVEPPPDDGHSTEDDPHEIEFDVQSLASLGVRLGKVKASSPRRIERIQAVLEHSPSSKHIVSAPFAGRVASLDATIGSRVDANTSTVTVERDRLPPFEPKRAAPILQTVNEELHDSYGKLMQAVRKRQIFQEELARLERLDTAAGDEVPLVSRQKLIELRYDVRRASAEVEALTHKLEAHGVSASQIDSILEGGHPPHGTSLWQRALAHHGLWTKLSDEIRELLPEGVRTLPRTTALLGELHATGLLDRALVESIASRKPLRDNFADFARLRLDGFSLTRLESIGSRGGLRRRMRLRASSTEPASEDASWDLEAYHVAVGEHVEAGQPLVTLRDSSTMHLVLSPIGDEIAALRLAVQKRERIQAKPLVDGTGPALDGLRIAKIDSTASDGGGHRVRAFATCDNSALVIDESGVRTWSLLAGTRYVATVQVPRAGDPTIAVPIDGIVRRGSEAFVFVFEHGHMHEHEVRIVDSDDEFAYVATGAFDTDESIAVKGALALSLALQRAGADDAGHGHDH